MNRTANLSPFGLVDGARFSRRRLLALLLLLVALPSLHAAPKGGKTKREPSPQASSPEVCIVEKIRQVTADKAAVSFRVLRDDDTWSDNTFEMTWPHANALVGQFFMAERGGEGWTLARVFTAAESKTYAEILQKKRTDKARSKSLRQRLLDEFLTTVRL